ncbi:DEAD/DEAH box helicase family protein, partial [candidate division KSB1 bacterium]|nr:DEAD/DEAH box helicase family protein [candidate division KSB1 bacterium]
MTNFTIMGSTESHSQYANVVFPLPVDHGFTYRIPDRFVDAVSPGMRVLVPFGPRKTTGFVVNLLQQTDRRDLKDIEEVLDPVPLFPPEVLRLAQWIAAYYVCGWGEVLKAALPAGIHQNSVKLVRLTHDNPAHLAELLQSRAPRQAAIIRALTKLSPIPMSRLIKQLDNTNIYASLTKLRQAGFVRMELMLPRPKVGQKYETFITVPPQYGFDELTAMADAVRKIAPKQAVLLEFLCRHLDSEFTRPELARKAGVGTGIVKSIEDRGVLQRHTTVVMRDYYGDLEVEPPQKLILNPDQKRALDTINTCLQARKFSPIVLHGVTGSGKTQVYIEAIAGVLAEGGSAVVLVPEIALTPQMVRRFR